jgi:hypothetical protein
MTAMEPVPASEIDAFIEAVRAHPEYWDANWVGKTYASHGSTVMPDPYDRRICDLARQALQARTPLSIVRMGDGEMNLLTYRAYPGSPLLDRYSVLKTVEQQLDRFVPDDVWMLALREMMLSAVQQADVVGVLGLWRPKPLPDVDLIIDALARDLRGSSGYWRGIDFMLRLAESGMLKNKIVASAHLYFGILDHLDELVLASRRTYLITNRSELLRAMIDRHAGMQFDLIEIGGTAQAEMPFATPAFLVDFHSKLPPDLAGCCCLIGAGPWAEIYCSWVKRRGGVAIDLGSGFDLLAGTVSRPVHVDLGLDRANPYVVHPSCSSPPETAKSS